MSLELTEKELERLTSVLSAASASALLYSKSETAQQRAQVIAHKRLVKELTELAGYSEDAAKAIASKIQAEEKEAKFAAEKFKKEQLREEKIVEGFKKTYEGLKQFAIGSVNSAQTLHNTENAFSAVIPTMNLLGDVVKNAMSAFSSFFSGIPILGGIVEGVNKTTQVAVDVTMKIMGMQVEAAQKAVSDFNAMSRAGMTFGGDLQQLHQYAQAAGMGIHTFTQFATSNIESLHKLGAGLDSSAAIVGQMSSRLRLSNAGLFSMYGNVADFSSAVADYAGIMSGYGIDVTKNTKYLNTGAKEYLYNLKELASMTGKNVNTLKKEEEARMKMVTFQLERGKLDVTQQANIDKAINVTSSLYGDFAGKFATEYFANKGKIMSPEGLMFQSTNEVLAKLIKDQIDLARQTGVEQTDYIRSQAAMIREAMPKLVAKAEQDQERGMLVQSQVKNTMLDMENVTNSAVIASKVAQGNAEELAKTLVGNRSRAEFNDKVPGGTSISRVANAIENYNVEMDKVTMKNIDLVGNIVEKLIKINQKLFTNDFTTEVFDTAVNKFSEAIDKVVELLGGTPGRTSTTTTSDTTTTVATQAAVAALQQDRANRGLPNLSEDRLLGIIPSPAEIAARNRINAEEAARAINPNAPQPGSARLNIPVKGNEYTERGVPSEKLTSALNAIYDRFSRPSNWQVTAGMDLEHTRGEHPAGRAADIKVRGAETYQQVNTLVKLINEEAKAAGIKGRAEAHEDIDMSTKKGTGKYHIHYKLSPEELAGLLIDKLDRQHDTQVAILDRLGQQVDNGDKLLRVMS